MAYIMSFQNCSEVLVLVEKLIIQHQKYCNSSVLHHLNREEVIQRGSYSIKWKKSMS